ncbi:transporter substrate-binding domain-containing protein [Acidisoma silvae]|uniref:Transporter substrate-binding domain-containing protein n=1 Tax=Acidisoma silvae TaxID=2802396 RepID=A0A963YUY7_9PROT|nr:transporter substrate-binding domain-containing protein [Acidisoma silvae]MCB8877489.1 transporter substrate-binding domain-containing protein [Acidisoma silvae]
MGASTWIGRVAGLACLLAAPAVAQAHSLDEILSAKTLVVGINPNLPPLGSFSDTNQVQGFDVDIANKLGSMLGVTVQLVQVNSADRVPYLLTGKADLMMGALTRTPARAQVIDFSLPIQTEAISALVKDGSAFKTMQDLNATSVKLIEVRGTTPVDYVKQNLPKAQVTLFDNYPDAVRAFEQGRGDAIVDVVDYLGTYTKNYPAKTRTIADKNAEVDYDAIGLAFGNEPLKAWLNVAIYELETDGFLNDTYKKWFGMAPVYPIPTTPYF